MYAQNKYIFKDVSNLFYMHVFFTGNDDLTILEKMLEWDDKQKTNKKQTKPNNYEGAPNLMLFNVGD